MYPFGVVEREVVHELPVEGFRIQQEVRMVIDELLLHGSIESLHVGIHLRCLGVGVIVDEVEPSEFLREVLLELTPVVRKHKGDGVREHLPAEVEELLGG